MFAVAAIHASALDKAAVPDQTLIAAAKRLHASALVEVPVDDRGFAELREALRVLPLDAQKAWITLIKRRSGRLRLRRTCGCASTARGFSVSVRGDAHGGRCTMPMIGLGDTLTLNLLDEVLELQRRGLLRGDTCEKMLSSRLWELLSVSSTVTVVDRYLINDAGRAVPGSDSGLARLVRLAVAGGVKNLEFHFAQGDGLSASDSAAALSSLVSPYLPTTSSCVAHVYSRQVARREMHDRVIGFAWSAEAIASVALGKGLGQFNGATSGQDYTFNLDNDRRASQLVLRLGSFSSLKLRVL